LIGRAPIYARDGWPPEEQGRRPSQSKVVVGSSRVASRPKNEPSYIIWQGSSKHGCVGGAPPVGRQHAPATFLVVPARAPRAAAAAAPVGALVAAGGAHYPAPALQLRRRRHQGRGEQGTYVADRFLPLRCFVLSRSFTRPASSTDA